MIIDLTQIPASLRAARKQRDLTLKQVASATGVSVSTISRLERSGKGNICSLILLMRFYSKDEPHRPGGFMPTRTAWVYSEPNDTCDACGRNGAAWHVYKEMTR